MRLDYEKTVDGLVKEIEFMRTFYTVTTEVLLVMIKDLHGKKQGLNLWIKKEKELDIRKLFDEMFSEKYSQLIGINLETNESAGTPTIIKYSREGEGKIFDFKFVKKEEGEEKKDDK